MIVLSFTFWKYKTPNRSYSRSDDRLGENTPESAESCVPRAGVTGVVYFFSSQYTCSLFIRGSWYDELMLMPLAMVVMLPSALLMTYTLYLPGAGTICCSRALWV